MTNPAEIKQYLDIILTMRAEFIGILDFIERNEILLDETLDNYHYWPSEAGSDFYLTRVDHCTGFLERNLGEKNDPNNLGRQLTDACDDKQIDFVPVGDGTYIYEES